MCATLLDAALQCTITEGEFFIIAVDKTVDKSVRIAGERCHACASTLCPQKRHLSALGPEDEVTMSRRPTLRGQPR